MFKRTIVLTVMMFLLIGCGDLYNADIEEQQVLDKSPEAEAEELVEETSEKEAEAQTETVEQSETTAAEATKESAVEKDIEEAYTTDLVFVAKEEDFWRVVDRKGNIFRVSVSYEGIQPGVVNHNATVETIDGEKNVSLIRNYTLDEDAIVLKTSVEQVAYACSEMVLKAEEDKFEGVIEYFALNEAEIVEKIGKGIYVVEANYDAKLLIDDEAWPKRDVVGWVRDLTYRFQLFGYDDNWVVPRIESLINQL